MQLIKILGFSHIVIALGAGVTVYVTGFALGLEGAFFQSALIVGALTGLGYTTQRFIKTMFFPSSAPAERNAYMKSYGLGLFIVWGAIVVSTFLFVPLTLSISTLIISLFLITTGLMYAWFPFRETPYLKLPLTSLVWAIATVILPVYLTGLEHVIEMNTVCTIVLARGLYIAGLTIPFDVRDLDIDRLDMKTLPQTIGVASSLYWAMILVGSSAALWFGLAASQSINEYVGIALGIHAIVTISFVSPYFAGINRHEIYHTIVLDGLLIVQIFALPISARCFI
ncbi:MAG: hypothetical protein P8L64_05010 [Flavobacteriales bacterium]|nr:hypothetical protein [Flavobacteriales bacterium]